MSKIIQLPVNRQPAKKKCALPRPGQVFHNVRFGHGFVIRVYVLMQGEEEMGYQVVVRYRADPPKVYRKYTYPKFQVQKMVA